jgi:hypothetical protein
MMNSWRCRWWEWRHQVGVGVGGDGAAVGLPLALAPHRIEPSRVCGESYSMAIIGLCAPVVPPIYIALCKRGPLSMEGQVPPIRAREEILPKRGKTFLIYRRSHS